MATTDADFEALLEYIKQTRGFDFTGYKRASLTRRFDKRMSTVRVPDYGAYRDYLEANPDELAALFNAILINVTSFFRDGDAWQYLADEVVSNLVENAAPLTPIRVWSTGCATGEEAYTIAMVFAEAMGEEAFRRRVKLYATDADDEALAYGRHARFTESQVADVPPDLRARYFEASNGQFAFRGDLRRCVIFGRHDLVQDPPISRVDLLVSRNTLIYFNTESQERILANFHYALRNGGFLFLGKSEALVSRSSLFRAVDLKRRIFTKVAGERPPPVPRRAQTPDELGLSRLASEALVRDAGFESAPGAQLVVDNEGRLAVANLQARMLFSLAPSHIGRPFSELEVSYRPVELRSRIEQAYSENHLIPLRDVESRGEGGGSRFFDVLVSPLAAPTGEVVGVGITFVDVSRSRRLQEALQESKREVETTYEELQSTVEELETTNEELQSTNEELETTNEELQSTNEELETMNEELQSTNEELEAINDQLQERTTELDDVNVLLESVLASFGSGVIVVDSELRVEAWNRVATDLWGLRRQEVLGRHLLEVDIGLPLEQLAKPLQGVLAGAEPTEVRVPAVTRGGARIDCLVKLARLSDGADGSHGAIVLMDTGRARE